MVIRCHRFCNHHLQFHVYRTETKLAAMADYVRGTIFYVSTLKALGKTNLNEINVTHTAMSSRSNGSRGMAFTIPGIYILNPDAQVTTWQLFSSLPWQA